MLCTVSPVLMRGEPILQSANVRAVKINSLSGAMQPCGVHNRLGCSASASCHQCDAILSEQSIATFMRSQVLNRYCLQVIQQPPDQSADVSIHLIVPAVDSHVPSPIHIITTYTHVYLDVEHGGLHQHVHFNQNSGSGMKSLMQSKALI